METPARLFRLSRWGTRPEEASLAQLKLAFRVSLLQSGLPKATSTEEYEEIITSYNSLQRVQSEACFRGGKMQLLAWPSRIMTLQCMGCQYPGIFKIPWDSAGPGLMKGLGERYAARCDGQLPTPICFGVT
jgi:hypothetical protein